VKAVQGWTVAALFAPPLLLLALYAPALDHEFVWTDQGEIVQGILIQPHGRLLEAFTQPMHPDLHALAPGSAQPYYRPLQAVVATSIDTQFGRRPRAFRSATLALGAVTMGLFAGLCWWLFRDPLPAAIAAALAAAHPAGVEMYVWIAGLSGALAPAFVMISLLAAAFAASAQRAAARWSLGLLSLAALLAGLLSKESAVVTPALLLAMGISHYGSDASGRSREDAPGRGFTLGLLSAQVAIATAFALWWRPRVLAETLAGTPPIAGDAVTHVATALASWPAKLAWLFAPTSSSTSDVVRVAPSLLDPMALLGLFCAGASALLWLRFLRTGRPVAALGLAWVWIAFLPTSGIVPLTHMRAERYLALSVFGAALLCADLLPALLRGLPKRFRRALTLVLGVVLIAALGQRTAARVPEWRSNEVLFEADTRRDPLFREGYYILATTLAEQGRFEEAHARLAQLRATGPHFAGLSSFLRTDDAFLLQCRVDRALGRSAETLPLFDGALRADSPSLPAAPALFVCGARALAEVGRFEEALAIALRVRDLRGEQSDPLAALVAVRAQVGLGQLARARQALADIPASQLRGAQIDAERRRVEGLLRAAAGR
jgi:tetratricopeptide (TPR) repeat protein